MFLLSRQHYIADDRRMAIRRLWLFDPIWFGRSNEPIPCLPHAAAVQPGFASFWQGLHSRHFSPF
jgi:hypothetical protein